MKHHNRLQLEATGKESLGLNLAGPPAGTSTHVHGLGHGWLRPSPSLCDRGYGYN